MASRITTQCRICGNTNFKPVLDLGNQPLSGVFPRPEAPDPSLSPLELIRCDMSASPNACGLVQLKHSADVSEMYGMTYGYYSSISPMMVSHLQNKVHELMAWLKPGKDDIVLDIGCNDGTLLNTYGMNGPKRIGMDPSAKKFRHNYQPGIEVEYDFFNEAGARKMIGDKKLKIITSIAMFYDLEDPLAFMKDIRAMLAQDGVWGVELSYLPLLLTQLTYDQVCHEHVTYLGLGEMDWMMRQVGLKVLDVSFNDMNGGSFYILAGREDGPHQPKAEKIQKIMDAEAPLKGDGPFDRLRRRTEAHRDEVRHFLQLAKAAGKKVYGYGASTKGNVVMNYCGLQTADLIAIGDRNPEKDGLVTPGTRIPIISHEKLRKREVDYLFVHIWHFRKEVIRDEIKFLERGGKMVFSLPRLHVVDKDNYKRYLDNNFEAEAYSL